MTNADLVIGIDASTTASKAIAWTAGGEAVAEGRAPLALANPKPLHFEQDPADWWRSVRIALRAVMDHIDPARIAGLAISNQRESVGFFTEEGEAVRPAILWLDERTKPQVRALSERLGAGEIHRISGKPPDVTPSIYRCLWMAEHEPENFAATQRVSESHGYLAHCLTGRWVTSTASADPLGLMDMANDRWSEVLLSAVGLRREQMPDLCRPGQVMGRLTAQAAAETGLPEGIPVVAGGGDGQCAGTGVNVLEPERAYINLGTAAVSGSYGKAYRHDPAFRTMGAVAETGFIYESCVRTGTFLVDWMVRELFNIDPRQEPGIFETLEAEAAASTIGSNGLMLVPYWSGVMTPYWDTAARGVIAGLSAWHTRGDVYRAVLEGLVLEMAMATDQIAAVGGPITHYVAIGGGASSDLWCQILADCSARPVHRLETVEASCLGAAMAAAAGAGLFGSIGEASRAMSGSPQRTFTPDAAASARYAELRAIHRDLWPRLADWNRRLVDFAEKGSA